MKKMALKILGQTFLGLIILEQIVFGSARGPQLGPDPNMPPEELLSFNLANNNNNNNNNNLNEFGKPRSHTKGQFQSSFLFQISLKRQKHNKQLKLQKIDL